MKLGGIEKDILKTTGIVVGIITTIFLVIMGTTAIPIIICMLGLTGLGLVSWYFILKYLRKRL